MKTFKSSYSIKTDIEKIFKFHLDPKNLRLVSKPNQNIRIIECKTPLTKNSQVKIKFNIIPFVSIQWDLIIEDVIENELIIDLQTKGPFKHWRHKHHFNKLFDGTIILTDEIEYDAGIIGKIFDPIIRWQLKRMFKFRYKIMETLFGG